MKKILVWGLYTRISHLLIMVMMLGAFLTPEVKRLLTLHVVLGYTLALLFSFRILWGLMDIKYSKFRDFNFNLDDLKEYLLRLFKNKKEYIGHNPASSFAIALMMVLVFLTVITGALTYGVKEGMGLFSFMNHTFFRDMKLFKEVHEFFSQCLMGIILIHIVGVLLDKILHKSRSMESMFDGYKFGNNEGLKLTSLQKIFGMLALSFSIGAFIYLLFSPNSFLIRDGNIKMDYAKEHSAYYKECISCHTLFPPFLLPQQSWITMMDTLDSHFGDDASLDEKTTESIKAFLIKNSANTSTKKSSVGILASLEKDKTYLAITETPFWKNRHKKIDKSVYAYVEIGKPSNCKACHANIENGLLNNRDIKRL